MIKNKQRWRFALIPLLIATHLNAQESEEEQDFFFLSLEQLSNIKVITSSKREQLVQESYANIMVVTKEMIERRGYRNVIEVLEDLPGFDFATYEDGGGEYPVHNLNRGIGGDNGNSRMLVMVDGMVQNHISFNWSQGLTDEQMMIDIERIEVVQGPGSALYGAQAVSGIVHIITRKNYEGQKVRVLLGENNTRGMEFMYGNQVGDIAYQFAFKGYVSDGDAGKGRPDPGNYFSNNVYPDYLTADYDDQGNFVTNVPNDLAGQAIPDGFNNSKDDLAMRFKLNTDNLELGMGYWDKENGLGSYVVAYEYQSTADDFITHHSAFNVYAKNNKTIIKDKLVWNMDLWYRINKQESDTGFRYTYRFSDLKKSYHSASSQTGFENQFDWRINEKHSMIAGIRFLGNRQTEQVVSLGAEQSGNESTTNSSWDIAVAGGGLGQPKVNEVFDESESAVYALFEGELSERWSYSIGERYSYGSDYGSTHTPRAGLIYRADNRWIIKSLYGSAFRQPSLFELHDEFRGAIDLKPESIDTYELEVNRTLTNLGNVKLNVFYSKLDDSISLIADHSRAGGERYANVNSSKVRGYSANVDIKPVEEWSFYGNYIFQQGQDDHGSWGGVDHTAKHKLNLGANWQLLDRKLNVNFRANYVGKRKVPMTNSFFDDKAPSYTKFDIVLTWADIFSQQGLNTQLIVNNLLDESYFGVGRQAGSSNREEYDPATNANPLGFIPPYHPQAGRTIYWNLSYRM